MKTLSSKDTSRTPRIISFILTLALLLSTIIINTQKVYAADINDLSKAKNISVNQTLVGTNLTTGDSSEDVYKFTVDKTGYITISFGKGASHYDAGYGWVIWLCDTSGTKFCEWVTADTFSFTDTLTSELPFAKGTQLYMKIKLANSGDSKAAKTAYKFCINTKAVDNWETEYNDSIAKANVITSGKDYYGSILTLDDYDYFKFVPSSNGKLSASISYVDGTEGEPHAQSVSSGRYDLKYGGWDLDLLDNSENKLVKGLLNVKDSATSSTIDVKKGQAYYIRVKQWNRQTAQFVTYKLNLSFTASGTSNNGLPVDTGINHPKGSAVPTSNYHNEWVNGKWYNADGTQTYSGTLSWKKNSKGWWIEDTDGWYPKSQWQKIDGKWYYFTADGYMDYSEYRDGYWLNSDGSMSELYVGGHWCFDSNGWWYEDNGWYPVNQYVWIDGVYYYFDYNGYMS